ncbi:MAG: flagellar hook-basal body complex protein, partial [Magnetospirillum sp.]|nr:flagellar hook-basal body complex protein [Magnetospirillum sp.]
MLFGAFNNSSSAMMAYSWDMGSIGQNIANVNTIGYKRKETMFQTVMSEHHAAPATSVNGLNIFGVKTADRYHIVNQGQVTPTENWSDLAINGRGFFMVQQPSASGGVPTTGMLDDPNQVMYTRDGAFNQIAGPDDNGRDYLISQSGAYLMGWMADDTGTITEGTLEPVYTVHATSTNPVTMAGRATTTAKAVANIPADAAMTMDPQTGTIVVQDGQGNNQTVNLTWTRVDSNTWTVSASMDAALGTVAAAGTSWTAGNPAVAYTGTTDISLDTNNRFIDGTTGLPIVDATGNAVAPSLSLTFDWNSPYDGGVVGPTSQTVACLATAPTRHLENISMQVFDSAFQEHTLTTAFERTGNDGWWMHYVTDDSGATLTTDAVAVTFDTDGKILTPAVTAPPIFDATWSGATAATSSVTVDLSGLTQYAGDNYIRTIVQDGYGQGELTSTTINERGELVGSIDNGKSMTLFKVP